MDGATPLSINLEAPTPLGREAELSVGGDIWYRTILKDKDGQTPAGEESTHWQMKSALPPTPDRDDTPVSV